MTTNENNNNNNYLYTGATQSQAIREEPSIMLTQENTNTDDQSDSAVVAKLQHEAESPAGAPGLKRGKTGVTARQGVA